MMKIAQVKTVAGDPASGLKHAIMMSVNISGAAGEESPWAREIAEKFKLQRMMSPPDTDGLMIGIIGEVSCARFAEAWRALAAADPILGVFMSTMKRAQVVQGNDKGQQLDAHDLRG